MRHSRFFLFSYSLSLSLSLHPTYQVQIKFGLTKRMEDRGKDEEEESEEIPSEHPKNELFQIQN